MGDPERDAAPPADAVTDLRAEIGMARGRRDPAGETPAAPMPAVYPDRPSEAAGASDLIDVRELLRTLWRRRAVILGTMLFLTSLTLLLVFQLTPKYTATVLLTLETRRESVVDIQAVMSGLSADASVIRTELDVLSSRRLIGKLVDRLRLVEDPEFNVALRTPNPLLTALDPRIYVSPDWQLALGIARGEDASLTDLERRELERAAVIDRVTAALKVTNPRLSYTIQAAFESERPRQAALLANTLAELYLDDQLEAKFEATQRATDWLNVRIGELRERVLAAENAVQAFRARNRIVQSGAQGTVGEQQLAELNVQLVGARAALAEAEARYGQAQAQSGERGNAAALGEVLRSPLIQKLGEQEAELRRKYAELSKRYGPRHPEVVSAGAELANLRGKLGEEVAKITRSVESDVRVARARVETLSRNLEELKAEGTALEAARIGLRELEREAESSRVLLETFMSRFKETSNQEDLQQADARIISRAETPVEPSFPNRRLILAVALVLSLLAGLGLAFLLEALDSGFRSIEHVERANRLKGLGMIPRLTALKLKGQTPFQYAVRRPTSAYSEALRSVHTTLMFGHPGNRKPRLVLVTSSLPGEGKTTFSLSLARVLAKAGNARILYVEADLRRPNIVKSFGAPRDGLVPLAGYLAGTVPSWRDCLFRDEETGLDLIATSGKLDNPQTFLQSERMQRLLYEAAPSYDLILVDTPPVLAVSDAIILSHFVDGVIFVVRWETTAREAVRNALELLRKAGAPESGVVLSQVDIRRHAYYGYGDYASYYGRYGNYYTN